MPMIVILRLAGSIFISCCAPELFGGSWLLYFSYLIMWSTFVKTGFHLVPIKCVAAKLIFLIGLFGKCCFLRLLSHEIVIHRMTTVFNCVPCQTLSTETAVVMAFLDVGLCIDWMRELRSVWAYEDVSKVAWLMSVQWSFSLNFIGCSTING